MDKSTLNIMYVLSLLAIMLSLAMVGNTYVTKDVGDNFRGSGSTMVASLVMPDKIQYKGTLLERFCYEHNQYYGLRN